MQTGFLHIFKATPGERSTNLPPFALLLLLLTGLLGFDLGFVNKAQAIELGRSGIQVQPPARGWKVEEHEDAAIKVWHFRAKSWQPVPKESGLIAVTISFLTGDPWKGQSFADLRAIGAAIMTRNFLKQTSKSSPFELKAGRFHVVGEDFSSHIDMISEGLMPISARFMAVRTGSGFVFITAFSLLPADQEPFAALFGRDGFILFDGPGSELFNGTSAEPTPAVMPTAPVKAPSPVTPVPQSSQPPTSQPAQPGKPDAAMQDLLNQMQQGFDAQ